jgi:hypothetical protein
MTDTQIRDLTFRRFELQLAYEKITTEMKEINSKLIAEAASRPQEHEPLADSDGTAWTASAAGCEVRVVFPTDTLKETIKSGTKVFDEIMKIVPAVDSLFDRIAAYRPKPGFRDLVHQSLAPKPAAKLISLCTSASTPKVLVKEVA